MDPRAGVRVAARHTARGAGRPRAAGPEPLHRPRDRGRDRGPGARRAGLGAVAGRRAGPGHARVRGPGRGARARGTAARAGPPPRGVLRSRARPRPRELDRPWRARRALPRSASSLRRRSRSLRPRLAVRAPLRRANAHGTGPARVLAPAGCSPRRRASAPERVGRAGPARRPARGHGRAGRRGAPRRRLEDARGLGPGATRCGARGPARARIRLLGRGTRRPAGHRPVGTAPVLPRDGRRRVLRMARAAVQPGGAGRHRPAGPRPPGARRDLRSPHRRAVRVAPPGGAARGALRRG